MIDVRPRKIDEDGLELTPVLDVIFILLIFFVLASAFTLRGFDLDLPPAQTGEPIAGREGEIRLMRDGSILCEGAPLSPYDLSSRIQRIVREFAATPGQIVVKAHPQAPVEALIAIVDTVRAQGGEKILVATSSQKTDLSGESAENTHE